uniref:Uncharacterized protein n=1 Tax=Ditylenchus dipsaci TaxID=166011 RepID=A0A915EAM2_9BILA
MTHIRGLPTRKENEVEDFEAMDVVPEIVIMHRRDSSMDTADTPASSRRVSVQGHRRQSRRMSVSDEFKRKKSGGFGGGGGGAPKRANWKAGTSQSSSSDVASEEE